MNRQQVCVIIAAHNAAATIGRAISSALREPEVAEVIVVDDASMDRTYEEGAKADDRSGRLKLMRLPANGGPSVARNLAIEHAKSPFISILDADDFFIQGRFARLLVGDDWDFVADNVVFIEEGAFADPTSIEFPPQEKYRKALAAVRFVLGNVSRRGANRAELGFLKPVMRRAFLDRHGLRYREDLRLGEDYELYLRALIMKARFSVSGACGYGAIVRSNSLSGLHRTDDLRRLADADLDFLATPNLSSDLDAALRRHERHVRGKYKLRRFLDIKSAAGTWEACRSILSDPSSFPPVLLGIAADKTTRRLRIADTNGLHQAPKVRLLFSGQSL